MRQKRISLYTIFTIFIIACFQSPAFATGSTARAGLAQAQQAAASWNSDVILVQLITLSGHTDGSADKWTYVFHSPKAKRGYQVAMSAGKIVNLLEVSASFTDAFDLNFVDSPQAIAEAIKKGLVIKGEVMMMLHLMLKNTKNEGGYWNILGDMSAEMSMLVDARTGKFYKEKKFQ